MAKTTYYALSPSLVIDEVDTLLKESFSLKMGHQEDSSHTFYDTFDWRLYKNGWCFFCEPGRWALETLGGERLAEFESECVPRFSSDFPEGEHWDELAKSLEPRALLALLTVVNTTVHYTAINKKQQTVARLVLNKQRRLAAIEPDPTVWISLTPLKGYRREYRQLKAVLEESQARDVGKIHTYAFKSQGLHPRNYSTKVSVGFTAETTTELATKTLLRHNLRIMGDNLDGIRRDLDVEYLHDFRVAIRRTRSLLAQIKGALDPDVTRRALSDFSWLGGVTNAVRDMDVFLLGADHFRRLLPVNYRPAIQTFLDYLSQRRMDEHKVMLRLLDGERCAELFTDWLEFLEKPEEDEARQGVHANQAIEKRALKVIGKRFHRVIKQGLAVDGDSPDQALHDLRIQCKKLRYLLEFFASIFPKKIVKALVSKLKQFQENLGEYNDLCVQAQVLDDFTKRVLYPRGDARDELVAMGILMGELHARKRLVRNDFTPAFLSFADKATHALFAQLGGSKGQGSGLKSQS